jgi:hypothetical protein
MSDKSKKERKEKYEWLQFSSAARPRTDETLCLWEVISISMHFREGSRYRGKPWRRWCPKPQGERQRDTLAVNQSSRCNKWHPRPFRRSIVSDVGQFEGQGPEAEADGSSEEVHLSLQILLAGHRGESGEGVED